MNAKLPAGIPFLPFLLFLLAALLAAPATRAQIEDRAEDYDQFGWAVARGDFNGDGFEDLAVGVPYEGVGNPTIYSAGAVNVIYGSSGVGLASAGDQLWKQNTPGVLDSGEGGDWFGWSLASGDFDGDGFDDLAVGVILEDVGSPVVEDAGAVNVLYGSAAGLSATGNQFWGQNASGVLDTSERFDSFGNVLASGDFDGDGFDDLAIGVAEESIGSISYAGAVNVLYGSSGVGLTSAGNQLWHQDVTGVQGEADYGDSFGDALAVGDFDGDGYDDLAIGVPNEGVGTTGYAGAVNVLYGVSDTGLTEAGDQFWSQNAFGILDTAEQEDYFGQSLTAGDFDGDTFDDLAIGVGSENLGTLYAAGAVNVLYGVASTRLSDAGNQFWHQDSTAPLAEGATESAEGAAPAEAEAPLAFALHGAAPNPFSASTRIAFSLAEPGTAQLTVYDVLGREVAVLVDHPMGAGRHEVRFEAAALPAGIYLVRLEAGGRLLTRPLTLAR